MSHAEQDLFTYLEHLSSALGFSGIRIARFLVVCVVFYSSLFVLMSLSLSIVLSVLLRFTAYHYPFGIFKLFMCAYCRPVYNI